MRHVAVVNNFDVVVLCSGLPFHGCNSCNCESEEKFVTHDDYYFDWNDLEHFAIEVRQVILCFFVKVFFSYLDK